MNEMIMNGLKGLASGFDKLDAVTHGWQNGNLIVVAGRPAMGKTAFALSLVSNMAIEKKIPVAMFSLEMSNVQLVNRLLLSGCEISSEKIKNGKLAENEWSQIDTRMNEMLGTPFYVDDSPSLSVSELRVRAHKLVRDYSVKMIIIDYLQLMNAPDGSCGSRQEEMSGITRSLKLLARELDVPIIALSQLNRPVEQNSSKTPESMRPKLCDLRESSAIEQDADMVCFIHRPEYYKIAKEQIGNDRKGVAEIIIAKHRYGDTSIVCLHFDEGHGKFMNEKI